MCLNQLQKIYRQICYLQFIKVSFFFDKISFKLCIDFSFSPFLIGTEDDIESNLTFPESMTNGFCPSVSGTYPKYTIEMSVDTQIGDRLKLHQCWSYENMTSPWDIFRLEQR